MRKEMEGHVYPSYRLKPNREMARQYLESQGTAADLGEVPLTYMIFLRGETRGVNLFRDLDIPRTKALHGGQRYEWFRPIGWDDEVEVTAKVLTVTEKSGRNGTVWIADIEYSYCLAATGEPALREITRIIKRG